MQEFTRGGRLPYSLGGGIEVGSDANESQRQLPAKIQYKALGLGLILSDTTQTNSVKMSCALIQD